MVIKGIITTQADLERVFHSNEPLHSYTQQELASGVYPLTAPSFVEHRYLVTRESHFYSYLHAEGCSDVLMLEQSDCRKTA